MHGPKEHLHYIMWSEFKQGNNDIVISRKYVLFIVIESTDRQIRSWFQVFNSVETSLDDEPRTDFDDEALMSLVKSNLRQSTQKLANMLDNSQSTLYWHLEKKANDSKQADWFQTFLVKTTKADRLSIATNLLLQQRSSPLLKYNITRNGIWVTYDNVQWKTRWINKLTLHNRSQNLSSMGEGILRMCWQR